MRTGNKIAIWLIVIGLVIVALGFGVEAGNEANKIVTEASRDTVLICDDGNKYIAITSSVKIGVTCYYPGGVTSDSLIVAGAGTIGLSIMNVDSIVFDSGSAVATIQTIRGADFVPTIGSVAISQASYVYALDCLDATTDTTFMLNPGWDKASKGVINVLFEATGIDTSEGNTDRPTLAFYRMLDGVETNTWIAMGRDVPKRTNFTTLDIGSSSISTYILSQPLTYSYPVVFYGDSAYCKYTARDAAAGTVSIFVWTDKEQ